MKVTTSLWGGEKKAVHRNDASHAETAAVLTAWKRDLNDLLAVLADNEVAWGKIFQSYDRLSVSARALYASVEVEAHTCMAALQRGRAHANPGSGTRAEAARTDVAKVKHDIRTLLADIHSADTVRANRFEAAKAHTAHKDKKDAHDKALALDRLTLELYSAMETIDQARLLVVDRAVLALLHLQNAYFVANPVREALAKCDHVKLGQRDIRRDGSVSWVDRRPPKLTNEDDDALNRTMSKSTSALPGASSASLQLPSQSCPALPTLARPSSPPPKGGSPRGPPSALSSSPFSSAHTSPLSAPDAAPPSAPAPPNPRFIHRHPKEMPGHARPFIPPGRMPDHSAQALPGSFNSPPYQTRPVPLAVPPDWQSPVSQNSTPSPGQPQLYPYPHVPTNPPAVAPQRPQAPPATSSFPPQRQHSSKSSTESSSTPPQSIPPSPSLSQTMDRPSSGPSVSPAGKPAPPVFAPGYVQGAPVATAAPVRPLESAAQLAPRPAPQGPGPQATSGASTAAPYAHPPPPHHGPHPPTPSQVVAHPPTPPQDIAHPPTPPQVMAHPPTPPQDVAHTPTQPQAVAHPPTQPQAVAHPPAPPQVVAHPSTAPQGMAHPSTQGRPQQTTPPQHTPQPVVAPQSTHQPTATAHDMPQPGASVQSMPQQGSISNMPEYPGKSQLCPPPRASMGLSYQGTPQRTPQPPPQQPTRPAVPPPPQYLPPPPPTGVSMQGQPGQQFSPNMQGQSVHQYGTTMQGHAGQQLGPNMYASPPTHPKLNAATPQNLAPPHSQPQPNAPANQYRPNPGPAQSNTSAPGVFTGPQIPVPYVQTAPASMPQPQQQRPPQMQAQAPAQQQHGGHQYGNQTRPGGGMVAYQTAPFPTPLPGTAPAQQQRPSYPAHVQNIGPAPPAPPQMPQMPPFPPPGQGIAPAQQQMQPVAQQTQYSSGGYGSATGSFAPQQTTPVAQQMPYPNVAYGQTSGMPTRPQQMMYPNGAYGNVNGAGATGYTAPQMQVPNGQYGTGNAMGASGYPQQQTQYRQAGYSKATAGHGAQAVSSVLTQVGKAGVGQLLGPMGKMLVPNKDSKSLLKAGAKLLNGKKKSGNSIEVNYGDSNVYVGDGDGGGEFDAGGDEFDVGGGGEFDVGGGGDFDFGGCDGFDVSFE